MSELKPESVAAVVSGKAMPADIFTGESLTKYFARKYLDMQAQRDMFLNAEVSWEKAMMNAIGEDGVGSVGRAIAELKAQRDALADENAVIRAGIPEERFIDIMNENMDDVSLAEDIGYNTAVKDMRRDIKTPATDAYLNSVRAAAVNHAGKMIFATMNHQDKGVERALECIAEVELQYTLAAQLRAGEPS